MPKFKENPGGMKPSGYKMKYQGNPSAFPFKSPVQQTHGAGSYWEHHHKEKMAHSYGWEVHGKVRPKKKKKEKENGTNDV